MGLHINSFQQIISKVSLNPMTPAAGNDWALTSDEINLLRKENTTYQKLLEMLMTCFGHVILVLAYFLIYTFPNPLNPVPSETAPPVHITLGIITLLLRDTVNIICGLHLFLKLCKRIQDEGLTVHMLSFLVHSEILHGLLEGFSTPVLEHALVQAGDANVA